MDFNPNMDEFSKNYRIIPNDWNIHVFDKVRKLTCPASLISVIDFLMPILIVFNTTKKMRLSQNSK